MATFLCHMPYIELISVKQVFQGVFFFLPDKLILFGKLNRLRSNTIWLISTEICPKIHKREIAEQSQDILYEGNAR